MLYFDTSFLAPLVLPEATSADIEWFMQELIPGELAVSHWTCVEFASLLAREVRMDRLSSQDARLAEEQFDAMVQESFLVLLPTADDFDLAKRFIHDHETGLRGGDSLHLAIASNNRAGTIYSLDRKMVAAGQRLGLPTSADYGSDLYMQAVTAVVRDQKVSISSIQRQLQIGYNRAARLVERMEQERIVSPANHQGKREVLLSPAGLSAKRAGM